MPTCANSAAEHATQRHVQACSSPLRQASKSCAVGPWRRCCNTLRKYMMCVAYLRHWRAAQSCSRKECLVSHHQSKAHPTPVHPAQHNHNCHHPATARGKAAAALLQKGGATGAQYSHNVLPSLLQRRSAQLLKHIPLHRVAAPIAARHLHNCVVAA